MAGPVVTIARQRGSGADEVAALVAQQLGVPLLDREVISRAATSAGVSEDALHNASRHNSLLSRMMENLGRFGTAGHESGNMGMMEGVSSTTLLATSADFRTLLERALRDIAENESAVIVGHAGQVALRGVPGTLHVFVHAPLEYRVAHLARAERMPMQKARAEIESTDRERVRYFRSAYQVDWYDLRLYDLSIDVELYGPRGAADAIVVAARRVSRITPEHAATQAADAQTVRAAVPVDNATPLRLGGDKLSVRPMTPTDAPALLELFRSLPSDDLLFLRRDVTDEHAIDAWARDVADGRMVTLLAQTSDGEVVGEASMVPSTVPWTRHVAEVRVITSPSMRGRGLGGALLAEIMQSARAAGIERLTAEMTVEQEGARRLFERAGFREEGRFHDYARDRDGTPHDMLAMTWMA